MTSSLLCGNFGTLLSQSTAYAVVLYAMCFSDEKHSALLLKFIFAAHFCASEFSLPELRLFVLLKKNIFQESSGSVYYSIFDFQGTCCLSLGATACVF